MAMVDYNYKQSVVNAAITSWTRLKELMFKNPIGGVPALFLVEETVTQMPDNSYINNKSDVPLSVALSDLTATFPLINPDDGSSKSSMSYGDLINAITSFYLSQAQARDVVVAANLAAQQTAQKQGLMVNS